MWSHSWVTSLIFLVFFFAFSLFICDVLNLRLILIFLLILLVVSYFLFRGFLSVKLDWESNKLRVLLNEVRDTFFFKVLRHIFFHMQNDTSSTFQGGVVYLTDGK